MKKKDFVTILSLYATGATTQPPFPVASDMRTKHRVNPIKRKETHGKTKSFQSKRMVGNHQKDH